MKSLVYETPEAMMKDLTAWVVIASADIASTPNLFQHVRQSFVCRRCYAMAYAATTLNNSCKNHLSLRF
ncbi:hypothetical protein TNCV_779721 [Trichonephila clavipes]|nr:hypothetical protein TNCV_779721 [Trichonephila clavipes]